MSADVPPPPVGSIGIWGAGEGELKTQKIGGGLIRAADSYHFTHTTLFTKAWQIQNIDISDRRDKKNIYINKKTNRRKVILTTAH